MRWAAVCCLVVTGQLFLCVSWVAIVGHLYPYACVLCAPMLSYQARGPDRYSPQAHRGA